MLERTNDCSIAFSDDTRTLRLNCTIINLDHSDHLRSHNDTLKIALVALAPGKL